MNIKAIIEDMDMKETVEDMIREACEQGLIEIRGYEDGEALYALTTSGRKLVETSDMKLYCEAYDATQSD